MPTITSQFPTTFSLVNLNGQNGVQFIGNAGDLSGRTVSSAVDVNGDGIDDLIIGTLRDPLKFWHVL